MRNRNMKHRIIDETVTIDMDKLEIPQPKIKEEIIMKKEINYQRLSKIIAELQFLADLLELDDEEHNDDLMKRISKLTRMYSSELKGD